MKVLITGATGFIGKNLTDKFLQNGHTVNIFTRDVDKAKSLFNHSSLTPYQWNSYQDPPLEAFDGIDGIIHLMGENIGGKRWTRAQKKILYTSRIDSARAIHKALLKKNIDIDFFVTASAIGIYEPNTNVIMDEDTRPGNGFLPDLCKDWEEVTTENTKAKRKVYIRTGVVLDKSGGALAKMLPPFKLGLGGIIGNGNQMVSWIHLDDLVDLYYQSAINPQMEGVYNACAPNAVDNFTFTKALGKALHKPTVIPVPALALKIAFGEMSSIILDSLHVKPKRLIERNHQFHFETIDSCLNDIFRKGKVKRESSSVLAKKRPAAT